jgi:hypothetical protein
MKKVLLVALLILASLAVVAATIVYTYTGTSNLYKDGKVIANGDDVIFDSFVYLDNYTYKSSTALDTIVFAATSLTDIATDTVSLVEFSELADVEITAKTASVTWYMYFNSVDTVPVVLLPDVEFSGTFNTAYFNKVYFKVTGTSTSNIAYSIIRK